MDRNKREQSRKCRSRRADVSPFKRQAYALVDQLPDDGTWEQLAERVQLEIDLEAAVLECERLFANPAQRSP